MGNNCTDKYAQLLLYISNEQSNLHMLVTAKACSNYMGSGEYEQTGLIASS